MNGTITNYFYDGDSLNVLYETNGSNQVVRSYTYSEGGQLLSMKKGSSQYFYHYNARGDVIALTDAQSNVVSSYEYDAWGNVLKEIEQDSVKDNPYRYAGYQYDKETGMYYLIARYYEPRHGVFLSLDPDPGDDDDILNQNGYIYANNNPVKLVDPDGNNPYVLFLVYVGGRYVVKKVAKKAASKYVKKYYGKIAVKKAPKKNNNKKKKEKSIKKINDSYLKKKGIDAHALKKDVLGKKAKIAHYDLYVDKNGRIWLYKKGGKGEGIPTFEYI